MLPVEKWRSHCHLVQDETWPTDRMGEDWPRNRNHGHRQPEQLKGSILMIMGVNSRAVAPYDGRRDIGLSVKVKSSEWTSINVALTIPVIIKRLDGSMAKATYFQMMAPEANRPGNPPLKWSGNDFSYTSSGRSTSPLSNPGVRRQLLLSACREV